MPIYDYRCTSCSTLYDIYHKTREIVEDVVCPSCGSAEHAKLMSVPSSPAGVSSGSDAPSGDSCAAPGGCCGGACGVN